MCVENQLERRSLLLQFSLFSVEVVVLQIDVGLRGAERLHFFEGDTSVFDRDHVQARHPSRVNAISRSAKLARELGRVRLDVSGTLRDARAAARDEIVGALRHGHARSGDR